jgi:hypothetical protein
MRLLVTLYQPYNQFEGKKREDETEPTNRNLPTGANLADAPGKAAGLARYAAKHSHEFGRIELIIVDGDETKRLDLTREEIRDRVKAATTREHLQLLYDSAPPLL